MRLGTALHLAVLEPQLWSREVAVRPAIDRRTKAGKQAAEEFDAEHAGKIVLSEDDAARAQAMATAIHAHHAAHFLLEQEGHREASYTWTDPTHDIECKTRPDWHSADRSLIVDLKTTLDCGRREFTRSIAKYAYHLQAAWNTHALGAEQFLIVAVESQRPYAVSVYPIAAEAMAAGARRIDRAMEALAQCRDTGIWPGPEGNLIAEPISIPGWCDD
jgi:exodeoxyribonuclease VIII